MPEIATSSTPSHPSCPSSSPPSSPSSPSSSHRTNRTTAASRALYLYHCPGLDEYDEDEVAQNNQAFLEYFKDLRLQHSKLIHLIETAQDLSLSFMDPECHVSSHVTILLEKTTDDMYFLLQKMQLLVDELDTLKAIDEHNIRHSAAQLSHLAQGYYDGHFVIMRLLKHGGGRKGHGTGKSTALVKNQHKQQILNLSIETLDITNEKAEEFQEAATLTYVAADDAFKTCQDINDLWKEAGKGKNGKGIDRSLLLDYAEDLGSRKQLNQVLQESEQYYKEIMERDAKEVEC